MSCNQQLESYLKNENFPVRRALNAATPRRRAGSFCRPLKSLAEFSCLRLLFNVEPPHGDDVGHEGNGLDDHARIRAREDVIREPERRIGQIEQARAAHIARPERDGRHAHGDAGQQTHRPVPCEDGVDDVQRQKRPQPRAALGPLAVVEVKHNAARKRQNVDGRGSHRAEQPIVDDPHQAGDRLRGEDDAAVIELHRDKHDQAAEQTQRLVEPEIHVPHPFFLQESGF